LGKRIRYPASDHDVNHYHNDHDGGANNHDDYNGCANDHYNKHNHLDYDHNYEHDRANDYYFLICPVVKALQLFLPNF
jgi:hypothetical protein